MVAIEVPGSTIPSSEPRDSARRSVLALAIIGGWYPVTGRRRISGWVHGRRGAPERRRRRRRRTVRSRLRSAAFDSVRRSPRRRPVTFRATGRRPGRRPVRGRRGGAVHSAIDQCPQLRVRHGPNRGTALRFVEFATATRPSEPCAADSRSTLGRMIARGRDRSRSR